MTPTFLPTEDERRLAHASDASTVRNVTDWPTTTSLPSRSNAGEGRE